MFPLGGSSRDAGSGKSSIKPMKGERMKDKLSVAVLGAGLMGHGIAQVFAEFGHAVTVYDPDGEALASVSRRIETNLRTMG